MWVVYGAVGAVEYSTYGLILEHIGDSRGGDKFWKRYETMKKNLLH